MNIKDELINNIVHAGSEENARKAIDSYTVQVQEEVFKEIENLCRRAEVENLMISTQLLRSMFSFPENPFRDN